MKPVSRRNFLRQGLAAGAATSLLAGPGSLRGARAADDSTIFAGKAQAMIMIYLPGGVAQQDTWDPKAFTPYKPGMKGNDLLGTCPAIPTVADGIQLGQGMEEIASVMDKAAIIRSLNTTARFGAGHVKAQFYAMTGYLEPVGLKPPSIGSIIARSLGPRHDLVPPYIYIGMDLLTAGTDLAKRRAIEFTGAGFYGSKYEPFRIADPADGMKALTRFLGMTGVRLDRRLEYLRKVTELAGADRSPAELAYLKAVDDARSMMDSPVKQAFAYQDEEPAHVLAAYQPPVQRQNLFEPGYYHGNRFGHGLLLARRLVERGARYVQVEYQYGPFKGFDMHESGGRRMREMKKQIDRPIAQLIRDLDDRGLLDETLVCIESEFGRTIQSDPADNFQGKAGAEPIGSSESHDGRSLVIANESMYGFHGHFSTNRSIVLLGAGIRGGTVYGRTADRHPMVPVENPVELPDVHASIFHALGIPPTHNYVIERRPFYVTKDGTGTPISAVLS